MADRRSIATASGRIVIGIVGVAIAAASIAAAGRLTFPEVQASVPSVEVAPTSADQTRVCAGPLLTLAADGSLSAFASASFVTASETEPELDGVESPDNVSVDSFGSPAVVRLGTGANGETPLLAATQSQAATMSDIAGFTATGCGEARAESWLVGGSSDVGRTSIISLTNPTASDATVALEFFGENGPVDAPGADGIIVKAGEQRLFSLSGFAPNLLTPVIKVTASGGQIYASLQQSSVRGITPAGVETSGTAQGPATEQHIAGVVVPSDAPVPTDGEGYDDSIPGIRIFVPGDQTQKATIEVTLTNEQGGESPMPLQAQIFGGVVGEVSLAGVAGGTYGVTVTSDIPVVASARAVTDTGGTDFAWFGTSAALDDSVALAVAAGPSPQLHLYNPTDGDLQVELTPDGGSTATIALPAGAATVAPLPASGDYTLSGAVGAYAQVVYRGPGAFSAFTVQPTSAEAEPVTVYPRG